MLRLPSADASPDVREAFIAGASVLDTPNSASSWAVVYRWPGRRRAATEASGRTPVRTITGADPLIPDGRKRTPSGIYPGTVLAAEWFACLAAVEIAIRDSGRNEPSLTALAAADMSPTQRAAIEALTGPLNPEEDAERRAMAVDPFSLPVSQKNMYPLRLCTTRRDIVDFLAGRTPMSQRPWLREIQEEIAAMGRVIYKGTKRFIRPSDRPYPGKGPRDLTFSLSVHPELIPLSQNVRARRVARVALKGSDRPETPPW